MGAIGVGLGAWGGAGAQNTGAMCKAINSGKSWGAKAFSSFSASVSNKSASQLARQTSVVYMNTAILGYKLQAISYAAIAIGASASASAFWDIGSKEVQVWNS